MTIAMPQIMPNVKVGPLKVGEQKSVQNNTVNEVKEASKVGSAFSQLMASANKPETTGKVTESDGLEQLTDVLNTQSVEELLDLLEITHDDGLLMIQVGEDDGQAVAVDELLNLENLMATLNIDVEQLQQTINQLLGEEKQASDLWELISLVDEQAPLLVSQISASLKGEQTVTPKESEQLLQLLKLAQLVGVKSDLTPIQETNLTSLKEVFQQALVHIQIPSVPQETSGRISLPGFQQVIQRVVQPQQVEDTAVNGASVNSTTVKAEVVSVTLPSAKPAQSEALLKEMQAIINKAQISNVAGLTKLSIKLYPENLGTIRIELVQQNGILTARLLASTALGRELLDSNAHQLKQAFVQQNIQVERLDIAQSLQDASRNNQDQNLFNNFFKNKQEEQDEKPTNEDEEKVSFSDFLLNEEV